MAGRDLLAVLAQSAPHRPRVWGELTHTRIYRFPRCGLNPLSDSLYGSGRSHAEPGGITSLPPPPFSPPEKIMLHNPLIHYWPGYYKDKIPIKLKANGCFPRWQLRLCKTHKVLVKLSQRCYGRHYDLNPHVKLWWERALKERGGGQSSVLNGWSSSSGRKETRALTCLARTDIHTVIMILFICYLLLCTSNTVCLICF